MAEQCEIFGEYYTQEQLDSVPIPTRENLVKRAALGAFDTQMKDSDAVKYLDILCKIGGHYIQEKSETNTTITVINSPAVKDV